MNIEQIKELMAVLQSSQLNKLSFKDEKGCELILEKSLQGSHLHNIRHNEAPAVEQVQHVESASREEVFCHYITSAMVGSFYLSPSPDQPTFIKIGDYVSEHTVVCIIEAMKVLNEIKAGVKGKIVEICIQNGHPVEFGTKLFRVEA